MVMIVLAALLPLALAGMVPQQQMQQQMQQQWPQQQGWSNSGWGNSGWGVQMQGMMYPQGGQQGGMQGGMQQGGMQQGGMQQGGMQQGSNNAWWSSNPEDFQAYLKWCEQRKMAMQEQEAQKELLEEIEERAEKRKMEMEREKAEKEMHAKRETMMAQWRMWQSQLSQLEEFDGLMGQYTDMKVKYMFSLTMEFLKFCRCSDYTQHLQRYLIYGDQTYMPGNDAFSLEDTFQGIDTTNVDAVAQRLASLSQTEQVKAYFGGLITDMCTSVKTYVDQVKVWEAQYNFMGI